MSFQEKIDKILKVNKLGINTVFGLEAFVKTSAGAISKPLNKGEEPGPGTIKKIQENLPGLNQEWWDTGKGEVFLTPVPKADDNKKNPEFRENVYRTIVEGNTEYLLIPRTVMNEVQLISTKQLENDRKVMDRLLDQNEKLIAKVTSLEPELPAVKKGK